MVSEELIRTSFGGVVRERRLGMEVSQVILAKVVGISRQTLLAIEQGKTDPKLTDVLKLCCALDIDIVPFVDMVDSKKVNEFVAAQCS